VAITLGAVVLYSRLGVSTPVLFVVLPLVLIGLGGGFFRPANQVSVFANIEPRDYGALSATLTSLGTLAGVLGTTITVAVTDSRAGSNDPVAFAEAIRFTFTAMIPLLVISIFVSLLGRSSATRKDEDATPRPAPAAASGR
jgi:hypothetical protein